MPNARRCEGQRFKWSTSSHSHWIQGSSMYANRPQKELFLVLEKKSSMEVLCKSSRSGLIFARENKFIQGIFFRTRGSGAGLYTDKHCWIRKPNMATVWRFRRRFTSVFSLLVRSQTWSQITDSTKKKYAIFKRSWKYLLYRGMCNLYPLLKLNASSAFRGK